jgi:heterodisulfide reductase subunit A
MMDAGRHPNIRLLTLSEVVGLDGEAGNFKATVLMHPRYVDKSKCTACGDCWAKCPYKADDAFDLNLRKRKAVYIYFPQGVPACATIDAESCQYFKTGKCRICEKVCKREAIDFEDKEKKVELNVEAVIVATGFQVYPAEKVSQFGFGKYPNVITSMQFERMSNATGPTQGKVVRPSDGEHARKIAFIQCVGSRDARHKRFCSAVCCMHSTKEAMVAREHDAEVESFIFYTDMRAAGKGFQAYVNRAENEYGVKYIRARAAEISQDENKNPLIWYENIDARRVDSMVVDIAVLATSLVPNKGTEELAEALGITLDEYGFFATSPYSPIESSRPGVFVCGYAEAPLDIPESVAQASGAAGKAAEIIFGGKRLATSKKSD